MEDIDLIVTELITTAMSCTIQNDIESCFILGDGRVLFASGTIDFLISQLLREETPVFSQNIFLIN